MGMDGPARTIGTVGKDETDTTYIVSQKTTSRPASNALEARCMDPTAGSAVAGSSVTERLA